MVRFHGAPCVVVPKKKKKERKKEWIVYVKMCVVFACLFTRWALERSWRPCVASTVCQMVRAPSSVPCYHSPEGLEASNTGVCVCVCVCVVQHQPIISTSPHDPLRRRWWWWWLIIHSSFIIIILPLETKRNSLSLSLSLSCLCHVYFTRRHMWLTVLHPPPLSLSLFFVTFKGSLAHRLRAKCGPRQVP